MLILFSFAISFSQQLPKMFPQCDGQVSVKYFQYKPISLSPSLNLPRFRSRMCMHAKRRGAKSNKGTKNKSNMQIIPSKSCKKCCFLSKSPKNGL